MKRLELTETEKARENVILEKIKDFSRLKVPGTGKLYNISTIFRIQENAKWYKMK